MNGTPSLSPVCLNALRTMGFDGCLARFTCGDLGPDYAEVKEVLERLRGKWRGGKTAAFVFPVDAASLVKAVAESGMMPPKNPLAFFPTPKPVIERLLSLMGSETWGGELRILEPSAGTGAIADALRELNQRIDPENTWQIDCCEMSEINRETLEKKGHRIVAHDFLAYEPELPYHIVAMNPPFSVEGDKMAYITHIEHAWKMLIDGGEIGAIAPTSWRFRADKRTQGFLDLVASCGQVEIIESGAFKESGTTVETCALYLQNVDQGWRDEPYCGHASWHIYILLLRADNDFQINREIAKACGLPLSERDKELRAIFESLARQLRMEDGEPVRFGEGEFAAIRENYLREYPLEEEECAQAETPPEPEALVAEMERDISEVLSMVRELGSELASCGKKPITTPALPAQSLGGLFDLPEAA